MSRETESLSLVPLSLECCSVCCSVYHSKEYVHRTKEGTANTRETETLSLEERVSFSATHCNTREIKTLSLEERVSFAATHCNTRETETLSLEMLAERDSFFIRKSTFSIQKRGKQRDKDIERK